MNINSLLDHLRNDQKLSENEINQSIDLFIRSIILEDIRKQTSAYTRDKEVNRLLHHDIYILDKYNNYNPPIAIKFRMNIDEEYFNMLILNFILDFTKTDFRTLIIVHLNNFTPNADNFERFKDLNTDVDIFFLNKQEINKLINKHKKFAEKIIKNLFSTKIQEAVFNNNEDWKSNRRNLINNLSKLYINSKKTTLLIGAGVSCSANLPSWDELISGLFITYLIDSNSSNDSIKNMPVSDFINSIKEINKNFSEKYLKSALLSARYLRKGLANDDIENSNKFIELLRKNLYKSESNRDSELINVIGNLCKPSRTGAKINSIINYNFDDILEQHFQSQNLKYKSIYHHNPTYTNEELPIFHVHGFIPEVSKNYKDLELIEMVFSEEGYHRMYSNPYHWSNLVQLTNFRDNTCIMIGLSMDDPNLRRLLDISQNGNSIANHYAFLKRISLNEITDKKDNESKNVEESFLESHHKLQELIFKELGVNVIWFEDFDELPKLLSQLLN
ncbi:SIR2 family protein [Acinetobacter pittii]|uniref:SIR2 family protein n=1 Tax=Acinetobacter pittii TaxID=48296 RepID=UPI0032618B9C